MDPTPHVDQTLRRWPGSRPAPASNGWPDWACRLRNAVRALAASAVSAHRARAATRQRQQQLGRLDDRLLMDIGVKPADCCRAARLKLGPGLPNPWR